MKLDAIVTLANAPVRLRFLALERSLRATGCRLPLRVIPYDDRKFALPEGATWWEDPAFFDFLHRHGAHPMMRKYLCLTIGGYQFVDSDVVFLRDPAPVLAGVDGWIASCGAWRDPRHVLTPELERVLAPITTMWQQRLFNSGQFACDRPLYAQPDLTRILDDPRHRATTLQFPYHEQPGMNLLVNLTGVPIVNLTLPPGRMESTWAGDYPDAGYARLWADEVRRPYLIHWAGRHDGGRRPIDDLFLRHFDAAERREWDAGESARAARAGSWTAGLARLRGRVGGALRAAVNALRPGRAAAEDPQGPR